MSTWMIDTVDRVGQAVLPTCPSSKTDQRFRKVSADTFSEAMHQACLQSIALKKLESIQADGSAIMSDRELDFLIEEEIYPSDVVSIPNPQRVGVYDTYFVARKTHPTIRSYVDKVNAEYEGRAEIIAYRKSSQAPSVGEAPNA